MGLFYKAPEPIWSIRWFRPELARYESGVVVAAVSTEAQHNGEIVMLVTVVHHEECQLIGKY